MYWLTHQTRSDAENHRYEYPQGQLIFFSCIFKVCNIIVVMCVNNNKLCIIYLHCWWWWASPWIKPWQNTINQRWKLYSGYYMCTQYIFTFQKHLTILDCGGQIHVKRQCSDMFSFSSLSKEIKIGGFIYMLYTVFWTDKVNVTCTAQNWSSDQAEHLFMIHAWSF